MFSCYYNGIFKLLFYFRHLIQEWIQARWKCHVLYGHIDQTEGWWCIQYSKFCIWNTRGWKFHKAKILVYTNMTRNYWCIRKMIGDVHSKLQAFSNVIQCMNEHNTYIYVRKNTQDIPFTWCFRKSSMNVKSSHSWLGVSLRHCILVYIWWTLHARDTHYNNTTQSCSRTIAIPGHIWHSSWMLMCHIYLAISP